MIFYWFSIFILTTCNEKNLALEHNMRTKFQVEVLKKCDLSIMNKILDQQNNDKQLWKCVKQKAAQKLSESILKNDYEEVTFNSTNFYLTWNQPSILSKIFVLIEQQLFPKAALC